MRAIIEDENAEDGVQLRVSIYYLKKKSYFLKTFMLMILYFFVYSLTVRIIVLTKKQETLKILMMKKAKRKVWPQKKDLLQDAKSNNYFFKDNIFRQIKKCSKYLIFLHNFRILKIESEFYKHVDLNQASRKLGLEMEAVDLLFRFWILKRRSLANRPLFIPRADDPEVNKYLKILFFRQIQNF